jgi:hypothetical protein
MPSMAIDWAAITADNTALLLTGRGIRRSLIEEER